MRPDRGTTPDMTSSSIRTVPRDDSYGDGGITRVGGGSAIALPPTHSRSKSTSEIDCPTLKTDSYTFTATRVTVTLRETAYTENRTSSGGVRGGRGGGACA